MVTLRAVRCVRLAARVGLALVTLGMAACTPTLSTLETARLTPTGHVQITASTSGTMPTGEPMSLMRDLQRMNRSAAITPDSAEELAMGTASLLVNAPGVNATAALAIGVSRNFELSTRVSTTAARFGVRHQLFRLRPGIYGVVGFGVTQYFAPLDTETFTNRIEIHHFSRNEIDVPLHLGVSGRVGHMWFGPKLVLARYDADVSACLSSSGGVCGTSGRMTMRGTASYAGGQFGLALGYRRVWVAFEMTAMHIGANANLNVNVSGIKRTLAFTPDGWLFTPAIGLITWF